MVVEIPGPRSQFAPLSALNNSGFGGLHNRIENQVCACVPDRTSDHSS